MCVIGFRKDHAFAYHDIEISFFHLVGNVLRQRIDHRFIAYRYVSIAIQLQNQIDMFLLYLFYPIVLQEIIFNRKRPGRSKYLLSVEANLIQKEKGQIVSRIPVRIVFVRNRAKHKDWIALISTDMDISEEEIIRRYGVRWNIEVYFKTCKQYLKLLKESNSPSFDSFTCHLAIVCVRYMILAVNQRAASDDRTLGELFWLMTAEAAEISFTKTLALILEALLDTVREFFAASDEQMQAFTHCFLAKLPQLLRSALGIPHPSVAA